MSPERGRQIAQTGGNSPKLTIPLNQNLYPVLCTPRAMRNLLNTQATAADPPVFGSLFYKFRKSACPGEACFSLPAGREAGRSARLLGWTFGPRNFIKKGGQALSPANS